MFPRRARAVRWAIGVGAAAMTGIGLVLMFLLAQATNNRALYERNYARLFGLNVVVAVLLLLIIGWVAVRLWMRLRQGKFGSRLLIKLAAIFALVGLAPGMLIYVVSYQFVSRSIESWFDVKVEGALDAGLNLGRATLDSLSADLATKARGASAQLADTPDSSAGLVLERIREQLGASDVVLWSAAGQQIAAAGASRFNFNPERPTPQQFRQVRSDRPLAHIDGIDEPATGSSTASARV
ncbi:MAG: PAS domain-containing sensor histidine kinase, partial [Comamonadaceae bacterium]